MSRQHREPVIFVVSNRLPVTVTRTDDDTYDVSSSSGGLVGALQGFAGSTEFRWYGWPGLEIPEQHRAMVEEKLATQKAYPVFFNKALADKHYNGFSSSCDPLP
jgi:trehalose 6-phosphate synthase